MYILSSMLYFYWEFATGCHFCDSFNSDWRISPSEDPSKKKLVPKLLVSDGRHIKFEFLRGGSGPLTPTGGLGGPPKARNWSSGGPHKKWLFRTRWIKFLFCSLPCLLKLKKCFDLGLERHWLRLFLIRYSAKTMILDPLGRNGLPDPGQDYFGLFWPKPTYFIMINPHEQGLLVSRPFRLVSSHFI